MTRNACHRSRGSSRLRGSGESPIGRPVPQTSLELAFEDLHLVTEHEDLDVLVPFGASCNDQVEDPAQAELDQREHHGR